MITGASVSCAAAPVTSTVGWIYLGAAATLGAVFIALAWQLMRLEEMRQARNLYLYSLLYLALLFVAMIVDSTVRI